MRSYFETVGEHEFWSYTIQPTLVGKIAACSAGFIPFQQSIPGRKSLFLKTGQENTMQESECQFLQIHYLDRVIQYFDKLLMQCPLLAS